MMTRTAALGFVLTMKFMGCVSTWAERMPPQADDLQEKYQVATDRALQLPGEVEVSITQHMIEVDGQQIAYRAIAGTLPLADEDGSIKADVFFIAYLKDDVQDYAARPITFCFNGGPGSSSVWLHMGAFGPKRVVMGDTNNLLPPPWQIETSDGTLLDLTDLVFIDPVTTGYSRAVPDESDKQFHGVNEDVQSIAQFIRLFVTRFERWQSPKYLAGESYGTTRAAALAQRLQSRHGMWLNGLILVSSILDFQTARFHNNNDLPYILFLPTATATAWYHGRLDDDLQADLQETLRKVEQFALEEYSVALLKGDTLSADDHAHIARELSRFTGVSEEFVRNANLRVSMRRFAKELMRDQRLTVGRLDSRFLGIDRDAAGEGYEYDPSYAAIHGPYTATLNHYLRSELGYKNDVEYEILTGRVRPWNYSSVENQYLDVSESLRRAMTQNQDLRVFIASGYYDFATPYFATDYTFWKMALPPELRSNVSTRYYESGHMMYVHDDSRRKLKADIAIFFADAQKP